jgi:hypothetical protein
MRVRYLVRIGKRRVPGLGATENRKVKMIRRSLIALALLAVPSLVYAQGGGGGRGRGMGGGPNPIQVVIDHKADLNVTDAQGAKLDVMLKALNDKNAPHMAEIQKMRDSGTMDREAMQGITQKIRTNNEEAQAALKDVLDAGQLEQATKLIAEAAPQRGRRGGGGGA